jgi:hypothetical protein
MLPFVAYAPQGRRLTPQDDKRPDRADKVVLPRAALATKLPAHDEPRASGGGGESAR